MVRHREVPPSLCHSVIGNVQLYYPVHIRLLGQGSINGLSWSDLSPYHLWHRSCGACASVQTLTFLDSSHLKSFIHTDGRAEQLQGHRLTAPGSGVGATLKVTDTSHKHT